MIKVKEATQLLMVNCGFRFGSRLVDFDSQDAAKEVISKLPLDVQHNFSL